MISFLRMLVILMVASLSGGRATGQDSGSRPDIAISLDTLSVAGEERPDGFLVGDVIDASVMLRNGGNTPLNLLRIAIQSSASLMPLSPENDEVDNDGDGTVDGDAERFQRKGREGAVWRYPVSQQIIEPGETLRRHLRFRVLEAALPGTSGAFSISSGSTLAEGDRSRPQRTKRSFAVLFAPPKITLSLGEDERLTSLSTPTLTSDIVLPTGRLPDTRLALTLSESIVGTGLPVLRFGAGITCDREPGIAPSEDGFAMTLGECLVDGAEPESERTVHVSLPAAMVDADATLEDEDILAWRGLSARLAILDGETTLAAMALASRIEGPLARLTAIETSRAPLEPGDRLNARFRISNRGDRPIAAPRIRLGNTESFACINIAVDDSTRTVPCVEPASIAAQIAPGGTMAFTVSARLREDALIDGETGIALDLLDADGRVAGFPVVPAKMAPPMVPKLDIVDIGTLNGEGGVFSGAIGATATLRMTGTLPKGRYTGAVRLLARMVDPVTGRPVAPATLDIVSARLDLGGPLDTPLAESSGAVWAQYSLPFDLSDDAEGADTPRAWHASFEIQLADHPSLRRNRVLELAAEAVAFGDSSAAGFDWREILVVEPDIRLQLVSRDKDRIVQPGERFDAMALACNYGGGSAYDTSLRIALPSRFDSRDDSSRISAFRIPLAAVADENVPAVANPLRQKATGAIVMDPDTRILTYTQDRDIPLRPLECVGLEIEGQFAADQGAEAQQVQIESIIETYASSLDDDARIYAPVTAPVLKFRVPQVRFGPPADLALDGNGRVTHLLTLDVPEYLGDYSLSLGSTGSAGVAWSFAVLDADGETTPWEDGSAFPAGSVQEFVLSGTGPDDLPLGWSDTTTLRALVKDDSDRVFPVTTRIVTRRATATAQRIETEKRVAIDRDCDGFLGDEHPQDALFEPGKDVSPGDCLIVRIEFINAGPSEVERIVIRDALSEETTLMPGSATVRIAPEPLDSVSEPDGEDVSTLEWQFKGLFRPGALGEVEYGLRLMPRLR